MLDKTKVGGSDVDQDEIITNGMKILRIVTDNDGIITRAIRGDQIMVIHLHEIISASTSNPHILKESYQTLTNLLRTNSIVTEELRLRCQRLLD